MKTFKNLDIFGTTFNLKMRGSNNFQTLFGTSLTFIFYFLIILAIYSFGTTLLDKTKPGTTVNLETTSLYPEFDLFKEELIIGWGIMDSKKTVPNFEDLSKSLTMRGMTLTTDQKEGTEEELTTTTKPIKMSYCRGITKDSKEFVEEALSHDSVGVFSDSGYCPDVNKDEVKIEGSISQRPFKRLKVGIYPCSLPDPTQCASPIELSNSVIGMLILVRTMNLKDKKNSINSGVNSDSQFFFTLFSKTSITVYFQRNILYDNERDFSDPVIKEEFMTIEKSVSKIGTRDGSFYCTEESIDAGICQPYLEIEFRSGNKLNKIERKYPTLLGTVSELGGFADLIFITFWFICFGYNQYRYNNWIREELIMKELRGNEPTRKGEKNKNSKSKTVDEEAIQALIEEELDCMKLVLCMQKMSILIDAFFESHHNVLFPQTQLNAAKEMMKKKKNEAKNMTLQEAYELLEASKPQNKIVKRIKIFFLENLRNSDKFQKNRIDRQLDALNKIETMEVASESAKVITKPMVDITSQNPSTKIIIKGTKQIIEKSKSKSKKK